VLLDFEGGNVEGGVVCGLPRVGCLGTWEGVGERVSWGVGIGKVEFTLFICGLGMAVSIVGLRPFVVGDGFHALHWNMLSWLEVGRCTWVLRGLRRQWVVRDVSGGCMLVLLRMEFA